MIGTWMSWIKVDTTPCMTSHVKHKPSRADNGQCIFFFQRLPGWILAVLPIFRFSGIPLLIESRSWAYWWVIQHSDNRRRHFLKMSNTASIKPGHYQFQVAKCHLLLIRNYYNALLLNTHDKHLHKLLGAVLWRDF